MKRKILRLLNLRTEEDFVNQRNRYQKAVVGRIERFNKLVKDLREGGVTVDKYLYPWEGLYGIEDWDTSKVTDISKAFSQASMTPYDIEKKNQQEQKK